MTLRQLLLAAALAYASPCWAGIVAREWSYHAKPPSGMTRVELHFNDVTTNSTPVGVLVLCPGMENVGKTWGQTPKIPYFSQNLASPLAFWG